MIEVELPDDIRNIENNFFFGFPLKTVIILFAGLAINTTLYFTVYAGLGENAAYPAMLGVLPFAFFACYKKDGQTATEAVKTWLQFFLMPAHLFYISMPFAQLLKTNKKKKGRKNKKYEEK